jgi:cobalamin biosynthesis Mg chelatase CobN
MERRYLAATLALVATFAIFSHQFRSAHLTKLPCPRAKLMSELSYAKRYVAERLMAKLQPYVDRRAPEEAQMVAELNLPVLAAVNERVAEVQAEVAQKAAETNCDAAVRAQENARRVQEAAQRAQALSARAAQRAQELGARAQERAREASLRASEHAMEINVRAIERAQRAVRKSQLRLVQPQPAGMPVHINFDVVPTSRFMMSAPVVLDPPSLPAL